MRLIDADALKEHVKKYTSVFAKYDWREICEMLNDAPTVDPVKHGHWEVVDGTEPRRYGCSVCKRLSWTEDNYCSYCGAEMDEVTEDDTVRTV